MKTRTELYGKEAKSLLRDITMYRALTEEQVLRLYPGKRETMKNLLSYLTKQDRIYYIDGLYATPIIPRSWEIWTAPASPSWTTPGFPTGWRESRRLCNPSRNYSPKGPQNHIPFRPDFPSRNWDMRGGAEKPRMPTLPQKWGSRKNAQVKNTLGVKPATRGRCA